MHIPNDHPTALISVANKDDINEFAVPLQKELGWNIHSSGGTCKHLREAGLEVTDVADIIGMPAILGHKVVTLHPKVHGGLLADESDEDIADMEEYGIERYDLACVDLYDLMGQWDNPDRTVASIRDKTDIGGPTMLRSAAKGARIVIPDPDLRQLVLNWLRQGGPNYDEFVVWLAVQTERYVSKYCANSADLLEGQLQGWQPPAEWFEFTTHPSFEPTA